MQPFTVVEGINNRDATVQLWVYDAYFPATINTIKQITRGSIESEEMTRDVFAIFLAHPGPFESVPDISQFLNSTATKIALKYNKKQDIKERHAEGLSEHNQNLEERNRANAEIDNVFNQLMNEDVEKLPRVTRYVFKLSYIDGLSNEQIALKQGISIRTVETHKTNAYRFLRLEVKKNGRDFIFTLFFIV
jgi:RNA polymerase sigma-70 factor (ECF subfamily)